MTFIHSEKDEQVEAAIMRFNLLILVAVVVEVMLDYHGQCCWGQPQLIVPAVFMSGSQKK